MQTLLVILLVAACVAYVARQLFSTLSAGTGKAGSCCSKGCGGAPEPSAPAASPSVQFIDASALRRKRK